MRYFIGMILMIIGAFFMGVGQKISPAAWDKMAELIVKEMFIGGIKK